MGPVDDRVAVAREHARGVLGRFAGADPDVAAVDGDCVAAQLRHPGLERDARPQGRFFEQHDERFPAQQNHLFAAAFLEGGRDREQAGELVGAQIGDPEQVPPPETGRGGQGNHDCMIIH